MTSKWWIIGCGLFLLPLLASEGNAQQARGTGDSASVSSTADANASAGEEKFDEDLDPSSNDKLSIEPTFDLPPPDNIPISPRAAAGNRPISEFLRWPLGVWLFVSVFYFILGWRQKIDGGGTLLRLAWVALLAAAIALAPVWVWLLTAPLPSLDEQDSFTFVLTILSVCWIGLFLRPPLSSRSTGATSTLILDEDVNSSIARIAAVMGIQAPRLFKKRVPSRTDRIAAFVGGLPQPSVVVTDGVMHRLSPAERDAVLAHEMAHIANHSLWPLAAIFSVGCAFAVWASSMHAVLLANLLGILFVMGLRRVVSRFFEADCDRRAARVVGFSPTISALYKLHAAHDLRNRGIWAVLAYACATHPSREVRLSLLTRAFRRERKSSAPGAAAGAVSEAVSAVPASAEPSETSGVAFVYSPPRFWAHRVTSCLALLVWVAALVMSWRAVRVDLSLILLILILAPTIFVMIALKPEVRRRAKRARTGGVRSWGARFRLVGGMVWIAVVATMAIWLAEYGDSSTQAGVASVFVIGMFLVVVQRRSSPRVKFYRAFARHDFATALRVSAENPRWRKNLATRYNLALLEIVEGAPDRGVAELEELTRRYPKFRLPPLALSAVLLDRGQTELAWHAASTAALRAPNDPLTHTKAARALRKLGRNDEARVAANRALELDGEFDSAEIVLASLALDAGSPQEAQRHIDRALDLSPGDTGALVVQAEIHLAAGDLTAAEIAIKAVATGLKANPFWFMNNELANLEKKLAEARAKPFDSPPVNAVVETSG